jgi:hypothetical protein
VLEQTLGEKRFGRKNLPTLAFVPKIVWIVEQTFM